MKLNKIGLIISREYSIRVKKKSFILTTILTPIFMAALIIVPVAISMAGSDGVENIQIVDKSGVMQKYFENTDRIEYSFLNSDTDIEQEKSVFSQHGFYALVTVSQFDETGNVSVSAYSKEPLNVEVKKDVASNVEKAVRDRKLASYNIENLDKILNDVKTKVSVNAITMSDDGTEKEDSVEIYMALAYFLSFMIYIFVFLFGNMVMRGVIEEKTNRIVEVIVSSVTPFELMLGKIVGVALVALTQFAIWILLTVGIVSVAGGMLGDKLVSATTATSQIAGMGVDTEGAPDVTAIVEAASSAGNDSAISELFGQLGNINFPYVIGCFLIYFLLGYLLYASMFAAVGSAVDNEADTQQLSLPVTIPLIIGLFIMLNTFQYPSSSLSVWASIIPFTSPMVMLARVPFGTVPAWQLLTSIVLLFLTFIGMTYLSGKIYKVGILTYGKKATFKDLYKWIKYKN
ncbi:MAG: ABC transporter permease [Bacteroidales bacterium]|nr:ABC transporter permease [Bacteroidales bacterium]